MLATRRNNANVCHLSVFEKVRYSKRCAIEKVYYWVGVLLRMCVIKKACCSSN